MGPAGKSDQLLQSVAEAELRSRITDLQRQLRDANQALDGIRGSGGEKTDETDVAAPRPSALGPPLGKRGYLFKWQDRSIGWGGTKWALRFVCIEGGKLSYYGTHSDESPRYVLTLRGCAVRDDGFKSNRRHSSKKGKGVTPPLDEVGAYYHVFSIYQQPERFEDDVDPINGETEDVVPLLRFSTPSLAEKNQWVRLISEACAYCDSDTFLADEAARTAEMEKQKQEQLAMANAIPILQQKKGTLPALYFAPKDPPPLQRYPSGTKLKLPKRKHYRTKSGDVNAAKTNPRTTSGYPPSRPMHRSAAPSYLSEEASMQNYRGLFNLAMIILVVSNFRLILETMRRHGFVLSQIQRPDLLHLFSHDSWVRTPLMSEFGLLQVFIVCTFGIEWLLSRKKIGERLGVTLHFVNVHTCLLSSIFIVWTLIDSPAKGGIFLIHATITWMKLISYVHANEDYRTSPENRAIALVEDLDPEARLISYPSNITLSNIYYFWFAPTLTYQIVFPRTPCVRIWKVLGILLRLFVAITLFMFLAAQVITPNLDSLVRDLEGTNGRYTPQIMAEYWLRLAVVNTYQWLLMFYIYFHLYLNLSAELLRFGDRVFYKDWWNSSEVSAYWRLWNMPVHYWLVRHVYFPCIRLGMTKMMATFVVFFISAIMHEVLISVPFHMIRPWSFLGMMMQMPLVALTKYLYRKMPGSSIGNIIFWMSFCVVGQPMAILLYTADYQYGMQFGTPVDTSFDGQCTVPWGISCLKELAVGYFNNSHI